MSWKMSIIGGTVTLVFVLAGRAFGWPVPDTGQTLCYDVAGNEMEACPSYRESVANLYGQDANYTINPPSYTKLDGSGNALPENADSWVMVRDNVTGLIWENKNWTEDEERASIHDGRKTFTWCDTNPATNGGDPGTCGKGTGDDATDTKAFIESLNNANFGGHSDWRIPTRKELRTIVDYGKNNPAIDTTYFPYTGDSFYWSSNTDASNSEYAWRIYFGSGYDGSIRKSISYCVRAVRGGQTGAVDNLIDNGDGTVTDTNTGLMWQKATAPDTHTWANALLYCEELELIKGVKDWRLPTVKEIDTIADLNRSNPAINTYFVPDTKEFNYVSSTTFAPSTSNAWHYLFDRANAYYYYKNYQGYVRCVRGGQIDDGSKTKKSPTWLPLLMDD